MTGIPNDLQCALDTAVESFTAKDLARCVRRLIERYREVATKTTEPILGSDLDVAAYAAYRMPATYAAARSSMRFFAELTPAFVPRTHLDIGGGTGAAVWAAAETWPSLDKIVVMEQLPQAIALGQRLAALAGPAAIRAATWQRTTIGTELRIPATDLVTMSYFLGELQADARDEVVAGAATVAGALIIVEPGTPAGYQRVVTARNLLIGLGLSIVAPCPHQLECPIARDRDWCHFATRINRSAMHRRIKAAVLGFEDEKFSYVAATLRPGQHAANRVLRHPQKRTGVVSLRLCSSQGALTCVTISKRQREIYRAARGVSWGETWPSFDSEDESVR